MSFCFALAKIDIKGLFCVLALCFSGHGNAEYARSKAALRAFVKQQACRPATGERRLPCRGWLIDHIIRLKPISLKSATRSKSSPTSDST